MSDLQPITVELRDRSYDIQVGIDSLGRIGECLAPLLRGKKIALITDPVVEPLYGRRVRDSLRDAGFTVAQVTVPTGEQHKNLGELERVHEELACARLERSSTLVALGGGVIGDLTGFAASSFLRGIDVVQVPTTLLAQVDSSIGGKTGVNLKAGKNLVGAFHQPRFVLADVETLASLPVRQLRAGIAEVVKYGVILSDELFGFLEARADAILALDREILAEVVHRCAAAKARVVMEDEKEGGLRAILNFGHTLGHAVEALTKYQRFLHGEAVAIGMVFAAKLSAVRHGFPAPDAARVAGLLERFGLPIVIPEELDRGDLARAIETDKKRQEDRVKFVCVERIGKTRFELLSTSEIEDSLRAA
ncbi:MAG: 3-dehydroquinate synthase [Candidatus Binatia bacterium]|nr:3-dehydroquinate synthase [Candidatus Binatia bacterium]